MNSADLIPVVTLVFTAYEAQFGISKGFNMTKWLKLVKSKI